MCFDSHAIPIHSTRKRDKITITTTPNLLICGIDEVGRGAIAGPLCAAAVQLGDEYPKEALKRLADSKQLSATQRVARAKEIIEYASRWAVAWATVAEIDRYNVLQATLLAMRRAYALLCQADMKHYPPYASDTNAPSNTNARPNAGDTNAPSSPSAPLTTSASNTNAPSASKLTRSTKNPLAVVGGWAYGQLNSRQGPKGAAPKRRDPQPNATPCPLPTCVIIDGPHVPTLFDAIETHGVVRADTKFAAVQAASILAKTHRDAWMGNQAHAHFPQYHFDRHKGYPTPLHRSMLATHGISPIHRVSFKCVPD